MNSTANTPSTSSVGMSTRPRLRDSCASGSRGAAEDGVSNVTAPPYERIAICTHRGSGSLLPDVVFELERHVSQAGWDQAPRLFALVATDEIISAEPDLADSLGLVSGG